MSRSDLLAQLLDERQDGAQGVVHVVRDAAGEVGHRVLAFRDQHALLERFGPPRVLQGHGRLGEELGDQLDLVMTERTGVDGGDLQDAQEAGPGDQGGAQDRPFARAEPARSGVAVEVEQLGQRGRLGVGPVAPVASLPVEAADDGPAEPFAQRRRQRERAPHVLSLRFLPGDLFGDHLECVALVVVGQEGRRVVVGGQ